MKRLAIAASVVAALVGCSQDHVDIGGLDYGQIYYFGIVPHATASGELNVVIRGNPFGPGPVDADALAAALPKPGSAPPFKFKAVSAEQARKYYHVVLVYNPVVAGAGDADSCTHPEEESFRPGGGPVSVRAVFCVSDRWASSLIGFGEQASGPQDPKFQALMRTVMAQLLPVDQPASNHGSAGQIQP